MTSHATVGLASLQRGLAAACILTLAALTIALAPAAEPKPSKPGATFSRTQDVVYGRKWGTALTMDVFTPAENANGAAIIWVVSGGWFSSHEAINPDMAAPFLKRGYTVFAVVHGSQPRYTIPEVLQDMNRAVRYIRYHARDYHIDPDKIGIVGASAGGHLSLMQGVAGDNGDPKAKDPVDRMPSRVQAVVAFFPPTDFLNYGKKGAEALGRGTLTAFKAPFDFHELSPKTHTFERITDEERIRDIGRQISPITHVTPDDPPTLLLHGDADTLVPIQQSEEILAKFREAGVPAELFIKKGAGHGWNLMGDMPRVVDWFDKWLKPAGKA